MNRKNTILIAVGVNAGLLTVLLIAALTTQEEVLPPSTFLGDGASSLPKLDDKPLFGEAVDYALRTQQEIVPIVLPERAGEIASAPPIQVVTEDAVVVHKLPPLVPENTVPKSQPVVSSASPLMDVTVKKGDSLDKIAKAHRTTVDELIKTNQLSNTVLRVGQVLKIPAEKSKPAEKKMIESGPEYYTVKVGDNPWSIAMKHHIKVEELLRLNGLNEERARKLKPGDRLRTR